MKQKQKQHLVHCSDDDDGEYGEDDDGKKDGEDVDGEDRRSSGRILMSPIGHQADLFVRSH